jgi:predicted ArsR family transcriptional regulator
MTTVRQKVLAYLSKTRSASAREISRALKMSAATVRHHLRVLASDGRLEMSFVRRREGRGRPEKVYSLPRATLGDNLPVLSDALLIEGGPEVKMEALAKRLSGESHFAGQPLAKRLNLTVEKLNQMNYHARWEAGSEGPRIIFGHCPYAAIIEKHPELCEMDASMLSNFMACAISRVSKSETPRIGICPFVFLIR